MMVEGRGGKRPSANPVPINHIHAAVVVSAHSYSECMWWNLSINYECTFFGMA
jgi:hypothetical protein